MQKEKKKCQTLEKQKVIKIYKFIISLFSGYGLSQLYIVKKLNKFVLSKLKKSFVIVDGHKMYLDEKDSLDLSLNGVYEQKETELVKQEIKEGDVVIDIGANIGYYTLIFARLVGAKGKVYAFEPDPINFEILKKNIEINGYDNVILINKALSDKTGTIKLFLSEKNTGDHRTYDLNDGREYVEVDSVRLDDYSIRANFIKSDIQGFEYRAFKGMENTLKQDVTILSEFFPMGLKKSGIEPVEFLKLLKDFDIKDLGSENILKDFNMFTKERNYTTILCKK